MQKEVYKGNYITVTEEDIDGHIFERAQLRSGVQVIPYENGKIMLIHESRAHETGSRWKLVSGWIDKNGKTFLDHAKEELAEEAGYCAKKWKELPPIGDNNFTISFNTHFFVCEDLEKLEEPPINPDENCEVFDVRWFSFDEIFELMLQDKILKDNTMMVALSFIKDREKSA